MVVERGISGGVDTVKLARGMRFAPCSVGQPRFYIAGGGSQGGPLRIFAADLDLPLMALSKVPDPVHLPLFIAPEPTRGFFPHEQSRGFKLESPSPISPSPKYVVIPAI